MGEYGHPHHMAVHRIAHELFSPVWDFHVSVESSVAWQPLSLWTLETAVTDAKSQRFREVYGTDVLAELHDDHPAMMAELFTSEFITGDKALPEGQAI
jgi:hypothetical protein